MLYFKGIDIGKLPYIGCADIIIYSISTALVFHAVSNISTGDKYVHSVKRGKKSTYDYPGLDHSKSAITDHQILRIMIYNTVKPVLSGHSKRRTKIVFQD